MGMTRNYKTYSEAVEDKRDRLINTIRLNTNIDYDKFIKDVVNLSKIQYLAGFAETANIEANALVLSAKTYITGEISIARIKSHIENHYNYTKFKNASDTFKDDLIQFIDTLLTTVYTIASDDAKGTPRFRGGLGYANTFRYPSVDKYTVLLHNSYKDSKFNNNFYEAGEIKHVFTKVLLNSLDPKPRGNKVQTMYTYFDGSIPFTNSDKYEIAYMNHVSEFLKHTKSVSNFQDMINDFVMLLNTIGGDIFSRFNIVNYNTFVIKFTRAVDKELISRDKERSTYPTNEIMCIISDIIFNFRNKVKADKKYKEPDNISSMVKEVIAPKETGVTDIVSKLNNNNLTKVENEVSNTMGIKVENTTSNKTFTPIYFLSDFISIQKRAALGVLKYIDFKDFVVNLLNNSYLTGYTSVNNNVDIPKCILLPDTITTFPDDLDKLLTHNGTKAMGADYILKDDVWYIREIKPETYQMLITTMMKLYELGMVSDIYIKGE